MKYIISLIAILTLVSCGKTTEEVKVMPDNIKKATFAGGCFWCTESDFEKVDGVIEAVSGFAGGSETSPQYNDVAGGATTHREAVQIIYNPDIVSYYELLNVFWKHIDPTDAGGQFVDRGFQYSSAIWYHDDEQKKLAEESLTDLIASGIFTEEIVTPIEPFTTFYPAEEYHQDYYKKNPWRYKYYRHGSGRDQFLESVWGNK